MFETPLSLTQVEALWKFLIPLMRTALSNITVETYADWGTCVATACVCVRSLIYVYMCVSVCIYIYKCCQMINRD